MNRKLFLSLAALCVALSPLATPAEDAAKPMTVYKTTKPGTVGGGRVEQVSATVTAIDAANRTVTLKGKKETDTVKVGPEVKNFDQIKVGDQVVVTVAQDLTLVWKGADAKVAEPTVTVTGDAAAPGQKPGADVKATIKGTVTVTKIDMKTRAVTVVGSQGRRFEIVAGPEVQLEKLKVGDKLGAEYTERVAVEVKPAPAKKAKKAAAK
jgi:Cu/Ag efflux protein CusF